MKEKEEMTPARGFCLVAISFSTVYVIIFCVGKLLERFHR